MKRTSPAVFTSAFATLLFSSIAVAQSTVVEAAQYLDVESGKIKRR